MYPVVFLIFFLTQFPSLAVIPGLSAGLACKCKDAVEFAVTGNHPHGLVKDYLHVGFHISHGDNERVKHLCQDTVVVMGNASVPPGQFCRHPWVCGCQGAADGGAHGGPNHFTVRIGHITAFRRIDAVAQMVQRNLLRRISKGDISHPFIRYVL